MLQRNFKINPEEKGKHGLFTTKLPNNGEHDRRNRSRSRSEGRNGNTKSGKQEHLPHMRRKTVRVKNGLHLMNKRSFQNIRLREDRDFASLYEDTKKKM